ncbi:MAG: GNAT family N-acetyltransferase [Eubacteriales bacterium]
MTYTTLTEDQITRGLFNGFLRHQVVSQCWRKIDGAWVLRDVPFVDDWSEEDYTALVRLLKHTITTGGVVFGAFGESGRLVGFASVEPEPFGGKKEYLDLSCLHVSEDFRGRGIGRKLFGMAGSWAKAHGASKLYISGHSAAETQAFYRAMGCHEALEYNWTHVAEEPFDCQLECEI